MNAFLAVLYAVNQLDQSAVKKLGPAGEYVFDLLLPPAGAETWVPAGQRLRDEVKAMGGVARVNETSRQFLGFWGMIQRFEVHINQSGFGDYALALLVRKYGDRIQSLDLRGTGVTNEGLRHLEGLSHVQHLTLGNYIHWSFASRTAPVGPITDAGLVHLKGLIQLKQLDLSGLPITDSGLDALKDLPQLIDLFPQPDGDQRSGPDPPEVAADAHDALPRR